MGSHWTHQEFASVDLGDCRLNKRLMELAQRMSQSPESSINQACSNWACTKAAYRFFDNDSIDYLKVLLAHQQATRDRASSYSTVLAVQDTTYFNYSAHPKTQGLCRLSQHEGKQKTITTSGLVMHSTLAVSPHGVPWGLIQQKIYARKQHDEYTPNHNALPIEKKESFRWIQALQDTHALFESTPIRVVTVCDREGDMYDLFRRAHALKSAVLVRAKRHRIVNKSAVHSKISGEQLGDLFANKKAQGQMSVHVPKQKDHPARTADCVVKIAPIHMHAPRTYTCLKKEKPPVFHLSAICVVEKRAPETIEPIEWLLVTNLAVENFQDALEKVRWYCFRWRIEMFHKVLKSGFRVETCRLAEANRLIRYLALMSVIAWRILWMTLIARCASSLPCGYIFGDLEWKVLFKAVNPRARIPEHPPPLKACITWLAQLGGFLARKGDKDPGMTHLWRGLRKFTAILEGVEMAQNICG